MEGAPPGPPDAPEEPPVAMFDYPMAELGAMVSGDWGSRSHRPNSALEPIDQVYWTPEVGAVMSDHGFVVQEGQFEVLHPPDQVPEEVVLVALSKEKAWSCLLRVRGCVERGRHR